MYGQGPFSGAVYRTILTRFLILGVLLPNVAGRVLAAETISLRPAVSAGSLTNVEVVMQVGGDLLLNNPEQPATGGISLRKFPMSVAAKIVYDERFLDASNVNATSHRSVRHYHSAKALVEIDKGKQMPSLADDHRQIVVETADSDITLACPTNPLTREELDLIDIPAGSLVLDDLLPVKPVSLGDSWKHEDRVVAALLRLDAISLGDVQSMLAEVNKNENVAKISLAGTVHGAVGGVATEIELKAKYSFDLQSRRITLFALLIKEKRSVGHIGPGLDVVAKQIVKIKPIETSEPLNNAAVATEQPVGDIAKNLAFSSPTNRFRVLHDRRWFVTSNDKKLTVFRLVDRGELLAQCNISMLDAVPSHQTFTLADFQRDIEKSLGKKFGQFTGAKEETDHEGHRVFRVVAAGNVSELPIQWIYYLFNTRDGQRLSVAFTMEQSLVERFGQSDRQFVSAIETLAPATAAGAPTPAKR